MQIKYSPCRSDDKLIYTFEGEKVIVNYSGQEDVFDFTEMPDGVAENIETTLSLNPIISAKREEGVLYLELLYFHGANASYEERFPTWWQEI
jgi:hypothetical protein